jgi:DNA-binding PadR family transcriptional regulator
MTPLKLLILQTLSKRGPQSELDLLCELREACKSSTVIVYACVDLQSGGFIQTAQNDPHSWQLTPKGMEQVASLRGAKANV